MENLKSSQIVNTEIKKSKSPKMPKEKKEIISTETIIKDKIKEAKNIIVRETVYIYPAHIKGNPGLEKGFRSSNRNILQKKYVDIYLENSRKKSKDFDYSTFFNKFLEYYKGSYTKNDFSVSSLRDTISEVGREELELFLAALKKHISK